MKAGNCEMPASPKPDQASLFSKVGTNGSVAFNCTRLQYSYLQDLQSLSCRTDVHWAGARCHLKDVTF